METNNCYENKYCVSFSSKGYDKDTTKVYIDGIERGSLPLMADVSEGQHLVQIKLLINFRWKEKRFDIIIHQNTLVVVEYSRLWGYVRVMVNGVKKA